MRRWLHKLGAFGASTLLHGALAVYLVRTPAAAFGKSQAVEFEVLEKIKPPPPPKPPEPPKVRPRAQPVKVAPPPPSEKPPPPPPEAPPPPNQPPPAEPPKAPVRILTGISLSSTSAAGGFAVPVGNTLYGKMPEVAPAPAEVKPYAAEKYVPPVEVTELPELVGAPQIDRVKDYPQRARVEGVEAVCDVLVRVGVDGHVERTLRADCTEKGYEFEDKARMIALRARFKPGRRGGEPVATDINYRFRFELE